jgi:hypothetical protein
MKLSEKDKKKCETRQKRKAELAARYAGLAPEERAELIPLNGAPSEFEVQAFLFEQLKLLGFTVRGEITTRCGTCRFDLVVATDGKLVRIIEVKKSKPPGLSSMKRKIKSDRKSQVKRYSTFGVAVDMVVGMREARAFIERVRSEGFPGEAWIGGSHPMRVRCNAILERAKENA